MHSACVSTKTISLRTEAYERLTAARRFRGESFSQVILRAQWPEDTLTAGELLAQVRSHGPRLSEEALDRVDVLSRTDSPAVDKWTKR